MLKSYKHFFAKYSSLAGAISLLLSSSGPGLDPWSWLNSKFIVKKGPELMLDYNQTPPLTFKHQYKGQETRKMDQKWCYDISKSLTNHHPSPHTLPLYSHSQTSKKTFPRFQVPRSLSPIVVNQHGCVIWFVPICKPFYSSQNPLNSSLTLKQLLLVVVIIILALKFFTWGRHKL